MTNDQHTPDGDDALADELRGFFARVDPVPDVVLDAARAAIEFRNIDLQIAELLSDTALEDKELAGVRGGGSRMLSFGLGEQFVELDLVTGEEGRADLSGYVVPAGAGTVSVETADGVTEAPVDDAGRFRLSRLAHGPARLVVHVVGRPAFVTRWIAL